jgi:hypothetical protein
MIEAQPLAGKRLAAHPKNPDILDRCRVVDKKTKTPGDGHAY